mmetsp:Transcript_92827/g.233348  ORF Transcript_92827/g.233348 Transcript_92827/m.233348 type:complete len:231 (+) Transcript_92827:1229-1921(+)
MIVRDEGLLFHRIMNRQHRIKLLPIHLHESSCLLRQFWSFCNSDADSVPHSCGKPGREDLVGIVYRNMFLLDSCNQVAIIKISMHSWHSHSCRKINAVNLRLWIRRSNMSCPEAIAGHWQVVDVDSFPSRLLNGRRMYYRLADRRPWSGVGQRPVVWTGMHPTMTEIFVSLHAGGQWAWHSEAVVGVQAAQEVEEEAGGQSLPIKTVGRGSGGLQCFHFLHKFLESFMPS